MPKISELSAISAITDDDVVMITDAETGASKKITFSNIKTSITALPGVTFSAECTMNDHLVINDSNNSATEYTLRVKNSGTTAFGVLGNGSVLLGSDSASPFMATSNHHAVSKKYFDDNYTTISGDSTNSARLTVSQSNDGGDAPDIMFKKSRGTTASPTSVQAADNLSRFQAFAYDGTAYVQAGNFGFTANDTDGNASWAVKTRVGDTLATRVEVNNTGTLTASGDFIHSPSSSKTPTSNGELLFEATDDATITVKYKGSDGVVRSGTISLS